MDENRIAWLIKTAPMNDNQPNLMFCESSTSPEILFHYRTQARLVVAFGLTASKDA
jgi:hypothetical protein